MGISDSPAVGGAGIGGFGDVVSAGAGGVGVVFEGGGVVSSASVEGLEEVEGVEVLGGVAGAGGFGADSVAGIPCLEGASTAWPELIGVS